MTPYFAQYNEFFTATMEEIAVAMSPTDPDINVLTDTIVNAVNTSYFGGGLAEAQLAEFKTLSIFAISAYQNGESANYSSYNMIQRDYIALLTQSIFNLPVEAIGGRLLDVQDNVAKSGLSSAEQGPILFAVMVGANSFNYWFDKVATPGSWEDFLVERAPYQAAQYMLITNFVAGAMEGALYGANIAANSQTEGYADNPGISKWAITALITGLTLSAGKVIYNLFPRIQNNCNI